MSSCNHSSIYSLLQPQTVGHSYVVTDAPQGLWANFLGQGGDIGIDLADTAGNLADVLICPIINIAQ